MATLRPDALYLQRQVVELTGLTPRQLDYWTRAGAIRPAWRGCGSGSRHQWTYSDVQRLGAIANVGRDLAAIGFDPRTVGIPTALVARIWDAFDGPGDWVRIATPTVTVAFLK